MRRPPKLIARTLTAAFGAAPDTPSDYGAMRFP